MSHGVVHFEIGGPDRESLQKFYTDLFGWTVQLFEPADYAMVVKMDDGIGGGIMKSQDGSPVVTFYVTCGDDVGGALKKAEELGGTPVMGPEEVPGGGPTIAAFRDPEGHLIGLVNGSAEDAAPETAGGAPVAWFEIGCKDASAMQDYYRKLFGWEINADNAMNYGEVKAIGNGVGGGVGPTMGNDPYVTVYVAAEDLAGTLKKAGELGGKTAMEPMQVPGGPEIAHLTDPAGNFVGLLNPATTGG